MKQETFATGEAQLPEPVDMEATGIDRPGLHAPAGERAHNETFRNVLVRNIERRSFLAGIGASIPVLMAGALLPSETQARGDNWGSRDGLTFKPIQPSTVDDVLVPENYGYQTLLRWGDPMFGSAPAFDPNAQTAAAQRRQFGYNCDFLGYYPLHDHRKALLAVNFEYTTGRDMFPVYQPGVNKEQADIEIAAHGGAVIEIELTNAGWRFNKFSQYNRRITGDTPIEITGPAAGHPLMKTSADPIGRKVLGMLNNCGGGKTPWGTWLTCEENFNQYFANNALVADPAIRAAHARYGVTNGPTGRRWEAFYDRFDASKEPNEPFRFGWVIEIDPYDPTFVPRKRTALGRTKHEAATIAIAKDKRVVVYSGDDQQFDYVYKFVSKGRYHGNKDDDHGQRGNRKGPDRDWGALLDEGTLYVAKFNDDNTGIWIPLTMSNPTLAGLFSSQGEILIKTRQAADAVGATAMDRPEDCQPNPVNGKVYLTMTNNNARTTLRPDTGETQANPRVPNPNGHIIELTEKNGDYGATTFEWEIFLLCGDATVDLRTDESQLDPPLPATTTFFAGYADATKLGKIAAPDNIAFDKKGNLWIATDGQPSNVNIGRPNDAIHAVPTAGRDRGYLRQFLSGPKECEVCGPEFSDDGKTLFAAIQHPGEGGGFPNTVSTWPDRTGVVRPAVVTVRHRDGKTIGS